MLCGGQGPLQDPKRSRPFGRGKMGLRTLFSKTVKRYSINMKRFGFLFLWAITAMPLCAQKNLLPAAKTMLSKQVGKAAFSSAWPGVAAASRLPAEALPQGAVSTPSAVFERHLLKQEQVLPVPVKQANTRLDLRKINLLKNPARRPVGEINSYEGSIKSAALEQEIEQLWRENERFVYNWLFENVYKPMSAPTEFAYRNNKIVLAAARNVFKKMQWLENLRGQGRNEMKDVYGSAALEELCKKLSNEKLILLGENHYVDDIQRTVGRILVRLKEENPQRRVVLFTEFIDLPEAGSKPQKTALNAYFRRVQAKDIAPVTQKDLQEKNLNPVAYAVDLFEVLAEENIEIYPLEDRTLENLLQEEEGSLEMAETSALSIALRNKTWARVMESKMAEIRQTDPDALFVVYAGKAHTSWLIPYAMPKFFAKEDPAVVELTMGGPSGFSSLYSIWMEDDPFFKIRQHMSLHYWTGPLAKRLGKSTGFDYMLILPLRGMF